MRFAFGFALFLPLPALSFQNVANRYSKIPFTSLTSPLYLSTTEREEEQPSTPDILQPFAPAADPDYMNTGEIGQETFVIDRHGEPTAAELEDHNILKIVTIDCTDLEVNTLVWKCLGYRFDGTSWQAEACFPKWKQKYPTPPDMIGMQRIYEKEVDQPSLRANQSIVRSVPVHAKQSLKQYMKPLGWKGYQYAELTPNKTRRAQCANWLLYYREELFGYTVEELLERRSQRQEAEKEDDDEWKPPVKEVY